MHISLQLLLSKPCNGCKIIRQIIGALIQKYKKQKYQYTHILTLLYAGKLNLISPLSDPLTILWPFSRTVLLLIRTNYDSMVKFELETVRMNTIILFFSNKNCKNIVYLSLKAVLWFTIGETSPLGLAIGRSEIKVVVSHSNSNWKLIWSSSRSLTP